MFFTTSIIKCGLGRTAMQKKTHTKTLWKGQGKIGITLSTNEHGPGLLVTAVSEDGQAHRLGLRAGDVVLAINNTLAKHHSSTIAQIDESNEEVTFNFVSPEELRPDILRQMEA